MYYLIYKTYMKTKTWTADWKTKSWRYRIFIN